ncbi:hypothetical protein H9Q73_014108 [Fusarium xylarioides]|nr:hypothetical protein H9Q73_014108 [Fusarium xylarioides]
MASGSNTRAPPTVRGLASISSTSSHIRLLKTYEAGNASGTTALDPLAVDIVAVYATNGSKDSSVFESSSLGDKKGQDPDPHSKSQQVNTPKGKTTDQAKVAQKVQKGTNWLEDENMLRSRLAIWRILECRLDLSTLVKREQSQPSAVSLDMLAGELTNTLLTQISNLGDRPVAFIGHGYGTLLLQKMMLRQNEYPEKLKGATAAVVFFATPISIETDDQVNEWAANVYGSGFPTNYGSPSPRDVGFTSNSWKEFQDFTSNWNMLSLQFEQVKKKKEDMQDKDARQEKNSMGEANQITGAVEEQKKSGKIKQAVALVEEGRQTTLDNASPQKNEFQLGDEVWRRDCALKDIARMPGPSDPSFHKLVNFLVKSIQTNLLLEASEKDDKPKLTEVASHCTHLNHANRHGETALLVAVKHQEQDIVEFLLGTGKVEPNQLNGSGSTALHVVLQTEGKFIGAIVEKLLSYGADPTIADKDDEVPYDLVQRLIDDLTDDNSSRVIEQIGGLKDAKQHLDNPPPVLTVQRMRRLIKQRPPDSSIAFEACKKTTVTIREMFKLNQYIPLYKDVAELLYPDEPFPQTELAENVNSAGGQVQKDGYNSQLNEYFNCRRMKTSLKGESAICRWFHIPMNNCGLGNRATEIMGFPIV